MRRHGDTRRLCCLFVAGLLAPWAPLPAQESETTEGAAPEPAARHGVSGTVTDPLGGALAGVEVWMRPAKQLPRAKVRLGEEWVEPVAAVSGESGEFSVSLDVDGPYRMFLIHPDHPPRALGKAVEDGASIEFSFPEPISWSGHVRDASGEAVAGAEVTACPPGALTFGAYACMKTRSGEDGKYTFERLAEGDYEFQAWAPGFALSRIEKGRFPVAEDHGERPGSFGLKPGATVSGTLTDDAGTPLAGVMVFYKSDRVRLGQTRSGRDVRALNTVFSDTDGSYEFPGLPAGEPLKLFGSVARKGKFAESKTLTLQAGKSVGDVVIQYLRPATAKVHLIDRDEQPIESVEVLWMTVKEGARAPGTGFLGAGSKGATEVTSDGAGRFTVRGIRPDRYDVTLVPAGHRSIKIEGVNIRPGAEVDLGTHVAKPGWTLFGMVVDDLGQPIEGAKLYGIYLEKGAMMSRSVKTGADGRFNLGGLSEGPLKSLTTEAEGHATKREQGVESGQVDHEVVLERAGVVSGRVLLESGNPARRVVARLEDASGGTFAQRRGSPAAAKGDEEGRFEIKDAAPGAYSLWLTAKSARPLRIKDVVVEAGLPTDVGTHRLEEGRELSGNVFDARDGAAVANAVVKVEAVSGGLLRENRNLGTAASDSEGRFVVDGLGTGRFLVHVEHADYAPAKTEAILDQDEPAETMTIRLGQGGTLRGTVRDETGRPAAGRSLSVIEGGGLTHSGEGFVRTNDVGEYRVERVRPGSYQVILYPATSGNPMDIQRKSATIREGEESVVDFDNETKIRFEGLLTRGGRPVGDVTVVLIAADAGGLMQPKMASVDLSGRFELGLDRAGAYIVVVQDPQKSLSAALGQARIVVPDEPLVSQEIVLQAGTIVGSVLSASGEPIPGSVVSAAREGAGMNEPGAGSGALVEPDGSFRFEGVNDGTYTLTALADGHQVATRTVTVSGAQTIDGIDFLLEPASKFRGSVIDVRGNGIPGAWVFAAAAGGGVGGAIPTETDAEGFFEASAPSDGPCDIEAVAKGFAPGGIRGFVPRPESAGPGAVVTLTTGGAIVIRVVDADGAAAAEIQPAVLPERTSQALTVAMTFFSPTPPTDAAGISRVSNLPEGAYRVSITGRTGIEPQTVTVRDGSETTVTLQLP